MLGRGRDCTALFESYHAFTHEHARHVLAKYAYNVPATTTTSEKEEEEHELLGTNNAAVTAAADDTSSPALLLPPPPRSPPPPPPIRDAFYDLLCQRVAATLRQKGVDPIHQRTCTVQRMLYYWIVVVLVIVTAVGHAKVRYTLKRVPSIP